MTYCVAMKLNRGLIFMSDTRTNAGVDNVAVFSKMKNWTRPGDRVLTLLASGNLATTQAVISLLEEVAADKEYDGQTIFNTASMFKTATLVGQCLRKVVKAGSGGRGGIDKTFSANFILGGQLKGEAPKLFLVYPEGNFIECSEDTPFLQTGEHKYGRPIIIRTYHPDMLFEEAVKLLLVSFDSTIRSNLSVGLPLDLAIYHADTLEQPDQRRIYEHDPYYRTISDGWSEALKLAFDHLPDFTLSNKR